MNCSGGCERERARAKWKWPHTDFHKFVSCLSCGWGLLVFNSLCCVKVRSMRAMRRRHMAMFTKVPQSFRSRLEVRRKSKSTGSTSLFMRRGEKFFVFIHRSAFSESGTNCTMVDRAAGGGDTAGSLYHFQRLYSLTTSQIARNT